MVDCTPTKMLDTNDNKEVEDHKCHMGVLQGEFVQADDATRLDMTLAVSAPALGALLAKAESGDLKEVVYKTLANVDFTRSAYNAHFVMKLSVGFASCTLTSDDEAAKSLAMEALAQLQSFSLCRNRPSVRTSIIMEIKALRGKVDKLDSIDLNDLSQTKMPVLLALLASSSAGVTIDLLKSELLSKMSEVVLARAIKMTHKLRKVEGAPPIAELGDASSSGVAPPVPPTKDENQGGTSSISPNSMADLVTRRLTESPAFVKLSKESALNVKAGEALKNGQGKIMDGLSAGFGTVVANQGQMGEMMLQGLRGQDNIQQQLNGIFNRPSAPQDLEWDLFVEANSQADSLPVTMRVSGKHVATLEEQEAAIEAAMCKFQEEGDLQSVLELNTPFQLNAATETKIMRESGVPPALIEAHEAAHVAITSLLDEAIKVLQNAPFGTRLGLDKRSPLVNALTTHHLEWDLFVEDAFDLLTDEGLVPPLSPKEQRSNKSPPLSPLSLKKQQAQENQIAKIAKPQLTPSRIQQPRKVKALAQEIENKAENATAAAPVAAPALTVPRRSTRGKPSTLPN